MKKIILPLTFSILLPTLLTPQTINAQTGLQYTQYVIQNTTAELATTLSWLISTYPSIRSAIHRVQVTSHESLTFEKEHCIDASQQVTEFILTEAQKITHKKIDGVKIHPEYSVNYPMASFSKHIVLAQYVADEITTALETNDQDTLYKWRAVINHEATHIENDDLFWRSTIDFTMPFITHLLFHAIWHILPENTKALILQNNELYLKITTAMHKLITTHFLRMTFYRYQEKKADSGIMNDINLLNGMKRFLNDMEQINITNHAAHTTEQYKWIRWIDNFYEEHPLNTERIKKLNQRIALLEESKKTLKTTTA